MKKLFTILVLMMAALLLVKAAPLPTPCDVSFYFTKDTINFKKYEITNNGVRELPIGLSTSDNKYTINFGDGDSLVTNGLDFLKNTSIWHTYQDSGEFRPKITVTNSVVGCTNKNYLGFIATPGAPLCRMKIASVQTNISGVGKCDGSINITVTNGTGPYTFKWTNVNDTTFKRTTEDLSGLCKGGYWVWVTDKIGCRQFEDYGLYNPIVPTCGMKLSFQVTNASGQNSADGKINLSVNGGTPPYKYSWSNSKIMQDIDSLLPGNYVVNVTDNGICNLKDSALVKYIPSQVIPQALFEQSVSTDDIFPNPFSDKLTVRVYVKEDDRLEITLVDLTGKIMLKQLVKVEPLNWNTVELSTGQLKPGMYLLNASSSKGTLQFSAKILKQ